MKTLCQSLLLAAVTLLGGCLSRPNLARETFAFATPPPTNVVATNGPVLGIRQIFVAAPFASQELTYRTGAFSYERDPYAGFLVPPNEALAQPLRDYLRNSGSFRAVTEPDSALNAEVKLDVAVTRLYGDFRDRAHPAAVLELRFLAFQNGGDAGPKVLLQKDYLRNIPLQARTAAAVVAGWNEALKQIATQAAQDLHGALQ